MAAATFLGLKTWQLVVIAALIVISTNYLTLVFMDRLRPEPLPMPYMIMQGPQRDGFVNPEAATYLDNDQLFDEFYAKVYDQLVQSSKRAQAEVAYLFKRWNKPNRILDAGCGTGITTLAFAKDGAQKVVGIDKSQAMIDQALKVNLPQSTLSDKQKAAVEFRKADLLDPSAAQGNEFDAACLMYFTIYYFQDMDGLFRNLALWVAPGGSLAIQVVNKHKFDPLLDAASPFVFSLQKYHKERQTKSKVKFDQFDYEANFQLDEESGNTAEFTETFRYKDGRPARRQRHTLYMSDIPRIISKAKAAGWFYHGFIDQVKMGFEYSYLLLFTH